MHTIPYLRSFRSFPEFLSFKQNDLINDVKSSFTSLPTDQFRYTKIQPKTIDLSTRLRGIKPTNSVLFPKASYLGVTV